MNLPEAAKQLYDLGREAYDAADWQAAEALFRASAALAPHFNGARMLSHLPAPEGRLFVNQ